MDRLKRRNDLDMLEILREFHDWELGQDEPCQELVDKIRELVRLVTERHKREDAEAKR